MASAVYLSAILSIWLSNHLLSSIIYIIYIYICTRITTKFIYLILVFSWTSSCVLAVSTCMPNRNLKFNKFKETLLSPSSCSLPHCNVSLIVPVARVQTHGIILALTPAFCHTLYLFISANPVISPFQICSESTTLVTSKLTPSLVIHNKGSFALWGHLAMSGDSLGCHSLGRAGGFWHLV